MSRKFAAVSLGLVVILLGVIAGPVGCGGEKKAETGQFAFGWLQDLTGRAAFAVKQVYDGVYDYVRMTAEEDPIPGVTIKIVTYDTKSDYSRVPIGYVWLRGQNATLLSVAAHDSLMLQDRMEQDEWPSLYMSSMPQLQTWEWYWTLYGTSASMLESLLEWLREEGWDYSQGKPKIGALTYAGIVYYEQFCEVTEEVMAQYPDKYDWQGAQKAPVGTTAWAYEANALKGCDIILTFLSGTPLASFIKEVRARGFTGQFMGPLDSLLAYWGLMKETVPLDQLDGCVSPLSMPHLDETDNVFIQEVVGYMERYRGKDALDFYRTGTGYQCGWALGALLVDVVRRAAEQVGAENVGDIQGRALRDVIKETNLTIDGWGETLKARGDLTTLSRVAKMYEYRADVDKWVSTSDWFVPKSLQVGGE